jgi:hypothetical protein
VENTEGGDTGKYQWKASKPGREEMRRLYEASRKKGKPMYLLLREAVRKVIELRMGRKSPDRGARIHKPLGLFSARNWPRKTSWIFPNRIVRILSMTGDDR